MPDVVIRDVDEAALARLKARARGNGPSLGAELKIIIEQCLGPQLKTGSDDIQVAAQHLTGARRSDTEIQMSSPEVTRAKHRFLRIHPGMNSSEALAVAGKPYAIDEISNKSDSAETKQLSRNIEIRVHIATLTKFDL